MNGLTIALEVVQDYIDESLFLPRKNWPKHEFERRSTERWAAYELMLYLKKHWDEAVAVDLIVHFIGKMDMYAEIYSDTLQSDRFMLARDTAEEILYLFV